MLWARGVHVLRVFLFAVMLGFGALLQGAALADAKAESGRKIERVALLLEHEGEQGWLNLLRRGLEKAGGEFSLTTHILTASLDEECAALFHKAAAEYDLVLVASDRYYEILRNNAANYRKTLFGCLDAGIRARNIMCVTFADEQAAYLAGAAAAMLSGQPSLAGKNSEKILGWLSGEDTPTQRTLLNGFTEGARLIDPGTRVISGISGSFVQAGQAAEETRRLLARGAMVIVLGAGAGNIPALDIVRGGGSYIVGLDEDKASILPGRVLTSILKLADRGVYEIVTAAASGNFRGGEIIVYDLKNRGVDIADVFNGTPKAGEWPLQDIRRRLGELRREIISGGIQIQSLRARTLCDCR